MKQLLICALLAGTAVGATLVATSPVTLNSGYSYNNNGDFTGSFTTSGTGSVLNTTAGGGDTWDWDPELEFYSNRYHIYDYLLTYCIQSGIDGCYRWRFEHWVLVGSEWLQIGSGELRHPNL